MEPFEIAQEIYRSPTEVIRSDNIYLTGILEGKNFIALLEPQNAYSLYFRWHKNKRPETTKILSDAVSHRLVKVILDRLEKVGDEAMIARVLRVQDMLKNKEELLKQSYERSAQALDNEEKSSQKKNLQHHLQKQEEFKEVNAKRRAEKEAQKQAKKAQAQALKEQRQKEQAERIAQQREEALQRRLAQEKAKKIQERKELFQRLMGQKDGGSFVDDSQANAPQFYGKINDTLYYVNLNRENPQFLEVSMEGVKPFSPHLVMDVMLQIHETHNQSGQYDHHLNEFAVLYSKFASQSLKTPVQEDAGVEIMKRMAKYVSKSR